jgi:hypothetical protein
MALQLKDMTKWMAVSCTEFALVSGNVGHPLYDVARQKLYFFIMEATLVPSAFRIFRSVRHSVENEFPKQYSHYLYETVQYIFDPPTLQICKSLGEISAISRHFGQC